MLRSDDLLQCSDITAALGKERSSAFDLEQLGVALLCQFLA